MTEIDSNVVALPGAVIAAPAPNGRLFEPVVVASAAINEVHDFDHLVVVAVRPNGTLYFASTSDKAQTVFALTQAIAVLTRGARL